MLKAKYVAVNDLTGIKIKNYAWFAIKKIEVKP